MLAFVFVAIFIIVLFGGGILLGSQMKREDD